MHPAACHDGRVPTRETVSEPPRLIVADAAAWREWLAYHHGDQAGTWLVLAKKGTTEPTSLTYDEALDEAICHGWIDGQVRRRDQQTYLQRFTPRRSRSRWSQVNVGHTTRLIGQRLMHESGMREVERAKQDGRWADAYTAASRIQVPPDLADSLARNPAADAMFAALSSQNRYAVLHRLETARATDTRRRLLEAFVSMLARGETLHPQTRRRPEPS